MVGEEEKVERSGGGELMEDGVKREWGEEKEEEKE